MIKVLLKEPVGGMLRDNLAARSVHYMLAQGEINHETEKMFSAALKFNDALLFLTPAGQQFLVPADNIAYIMETDEQPTG